MGLKQSSPAAGVRVRSYSSSDAATGSGRAGVLRYYSGGPAEQIRYSSSDRSETFIQGRMIPNNGRSSETDGQRELLIGSLPAHLSPHLLSAGFHCPACMKFICPDEIDIHLLMCFSKPRLNYNEDILSQDRGECSICLDDMVQGDMIARLPCLCIYHKGCIDEWFEINRSCPEHPTDQLGDIFEKVRRRPTLPISTEALREVAKRCVNFVMNNVDVLSQAYKIKLLPAGYICSKRSIRDVKSLSLHQDLTSSRLKPWPSEI